jgi:hypothetical protein
MREKLIDRAREGSTQGNAADGGPSFRRVRPARCRKGCAVKADAHTESDGHPGQPQHDLRMSHGENR